MSLKNRYENVIIRNNLSLGLSYNALDYVLKLEKENELLNHYKLLYQKVKDRNDKAIEYLKLNYMNIIDNEKRYFLDYYIQEIYEILEGFNEED